MQERVKIFTFATGHGETIVESCHEERINQWLAQMKGRMSHITQSESQRLGNSSHVTVCVWYFPEVVAEP